MQRAQVEPAEAYTYFRQYPSRQLATDTTVLKPGDTATHIFYIVSGRVRMYAISPRTGSALTLHVFQPNAYFPLAAAFRDMDNPFFYDALEATVTHVAPASEVRSFLMAHPAELMQLTQRLLGGLDGLAHRIESLAFHDVYHRLLSVLLYLARHADPPNEPHDACLGPVTHQKLAEYVGASREATSLAIERLEEIGLIIQEHHVIHIPNLERLTTHLNDQLPTTM